MDLRERILARWGQLSARHPVRVTAIILVFILAAIPLADHLTVTTRWSDLLPLHDPLVKEFNKINVKAKMTDLGCFQKNDKKR